MSSSPTDLSRRQAAIVAGLAWVAMAVAALFGLFFALEGPVEQGDAAATVSIIAASEGLFRAGIAAFVAVFALDLVKALGLYAFFKQANPWLSLLAAWFLVVSAAVSAAALLNLAVVPRLVDSAGYAAALEAGQRDTQVMLAIDAHDYGWAIGLAFFGVHLLLLGFMALRSREVPSVLGILVALAGLGYLVDNLAKVVLTGYADYGSLLETTSSVLSVVGELSLAVWLLLRGGKEARSAVAVPA